MLLEGQIREIGGIIRPNGTVRRHDERFWARGPVFLWFAVAALVAATSACKAVPTPSPEPVPAPAPVASPVASVAPTPTTDPLTPSAPQAHVMLRAVRVTEDWMPFSNRAGGWTEAVPIKVSDVLRFYEAVIWEETDSVHLYAFPNDFDPWWGTFEDVSDEEVIAYREQYAISVRGDMPEESSEERSDFLRSAFQDFVSLLVERHPDAEHHLMYSGHGGPTGDLFERQLNRADADAFLAGWTALLGRPLGVIDMGGPCNKGGYEDLANFCRHARYYVASDLPNGGYSTDEWAPEKHYETNAELQYHRLLESSETLEEALIARVDLRRRDYEYSVNNLTQDRWPQASYVYSCAGFRDFSAAFEAFLVEASIADPVYDLYQLLLDNAAPPALLDGFGDVLVHGVDNRDFFTWDTTANGIISPTERILRGVADGV